STELAQQYSHVLVADIADFYNQISRHRLRNALETAGVQPDRAANTENMLSQITTKQSRGIPVGPYASIVLAEASLHDVDLFLVGRGRPHLRYVDDFRVFCTSRREANSALHDLSSYLHTAHRLTLQFSKTRIDQRREA